MIKASKEQIEHVSDVLTESLGSLVFIREYFEANNIKLEHLPPDSTGPALGGVIRSLSHATDQLRDIAGELGELELLDSPDSSSASDANKIIDMYLANRSSNGDFNQRIQTMENIHELMIENRRRRQERLSVVGTDKVANLQELRTQATDS